MSSSRRTTVVLHGVPTWIQWHHSRTPKQSKHIKIASLGKISHHLKGGAHDPACLGSNSKPFKPTFSYLWQLGNSRHVQIDLIKIRTGGFKRDPPTPPAALSDTPRLRTISPGRAPAFFTFRVSQHGTKILIDKLTFRRSSPLLKNFCRKTFLEMKLNKNEVE